MERIGCFMKRSIYRAKKRQRRTPGGFASYKVKPKKVSHAKCGLCSAKLAGVPTVTKVAKTRSRPERVFGGNLCPACTLKVIKAKARLASGVSQETEVPFTLMKYVRMLKG